MVFRNPSSAGLGQVRFEAALKYLSIAVRAEYPLVAILRVRLQVAGELALLAASVLTLVARRPIARRPLIPVRVPFVVILEILLCDVDVRAATALEIFTLVGGIEMPLDMLQDVFVALTDKH